MSSFRPMQTIVERFRSLASSQPDRPAYTFLPRGEGDGTTWRFTDVDREAHAVASYLQRHAARGDRVLLVHPPGLEFISAFLGCLYAGVIAVPAPPPRAPASLAPLERMAADCEARMALTTAAVLQRLAPRLPSGSALQRLAWSAAAESDGDIEVAAPSAETIAYLQYTSGSTGTPKGVMVSHGNLVHNLHAINGEAGSSGGTTAICWLPLFHDMGLVGCLEVGYAGGHTVLLPPLHVLQRPARWLEAITRFRGTRSGAPDFFYALCTQAVRTEERDRLDLSSWDVAVNGAETVRADTIERFADTFAAVGFRRQTFRPAYGLAESTVYVTGASAGCDPVIRRFSADSLKAGHATMAAPGSPDGLRLVGCGRPPTDGEVVIVEPQTRRALPKGSIGEIWTRSPSVAQGYWGRPEESAMTFRATLDGGDSRTYLRTGDLGFLFEDELFVTGRLKDLIIIRGQNHVPEDIEQTMGAAHPALEGERGAAFSIDVDGEERLVTVQELRRAPDAASALEIADRIREAVITEHGVRPDRILLVARGAIPRTTSGKVRRQACRESVENQTLEAFTA